MENITKILFIDTLTTGMNAKNNAIYAFGGIYCEEINGKIYEKKRFEYRIRPFDNAKIKNQSIWIGGYDRSDLVKFPHEVRVLNDFKEMISEWVVEEDKNDKIFICGYNCSVFDVLFLKEWFIRNDDNSYNNFFYHQTLDLMSISTFQLLNERKQMEDFQLDTVCEKLGVHQYFTEKFNCMNNANKCKDLYIKLKEMINQPIKEENFIADNDVDRNF